MKVIPMLDERVYGPPEYPLFRIIAIHDQMVRVRDVCTGHVANLRRDRLTAIGTCEWQYA